jgi:hypothetical protein
MYAGGAMPASVPVCTLASGAADACPLGRRRSRASRTSVIRTHATSDRRARSHPCDPDSYGQPPPCPVNTPAIPTHAASPRRARSTPLRSRLMRPARRARSHPCDSDVCGQPAPCPPNPRAIPTYAASPRRARSTPVRFRLMRPAAAVPRRTRAIPNRPQPAPYPVDSHPFRSVFVCLRPNIALQRTPLARPLGWARCLRVIPCRQPCRFTRLPAAPLKAGVGRPCNCLNLHTIAEIPHLLITPYICTQKDLSISRK